jgi:hypothetical protein
LKQAKMILAEMQNKLKSQRTFLIELSNLTNESATLNERQEEWLWTMMMGFSTKDMPAETYVDKILQYATFLNSCHG